MVRLWDVASGRETAVLKHAQRRKCEYLVRMAKRLQLEALVRCGLWDVDTKTEKSVLSHAPGFRSVSFSPNSRTLASTEPSHSEVHLWDVDTGERIGALTGHTTSFTSISFSPDRDSRILASGR